ncbi:hypothetical protein QF026_008582 [Streptomyces aurantiacus]|nr:hypothetical protein [Streptomyces aurantiacus]MDQ0780116.1 hypothetical protein [Streptomyces aurantiacus]
MDRDDEQLLRRRFYGADHDHPVPRPDQGFVRKRNKTASTWIG